jgi:very-short-patch-repair endonuclease
MTDPIVRASKFTAESLGWSVTFASEAKLALVLSSMGFNPKDVQTQFAVGKYRVDFAFPEELVALEADGWVHTTAVVIARDAARDADLRRLGWEVVRVDTQGDIDAVVLGQRLVSAAESVVIQRQAARKQRWTERKRAAQ